MPLNHEPGHWVSRLKTRVTSPQGLGTWIVVALLSHSTGVLRAAEANPQTEVRGAIQQLASQPNYSWTSTPKAEAKTSVIRQGPMIGKLEQDGYTYFRFMLEGNAVEVVLKGEKSAIKTETAWETSNELLGDRQWIARRLQGFKAPAAEAEELLRISKGVRAEKGGAFVAEMTADGIKGLLLSRSREDMMARVLPGAKGSVRFWIKKGMLARYEINLQGKIVLTDHKQEFEINRTTTVEISDVGSTKVQVPEEAKKRLG